MNMEKKKKRLPYSTPQIEQVRLVTEESVLSGCKTARYTAPAGGNCRVRRNSCPIPQS